MWDEPLHINEEAGCHPSCLMSYKCIQNHAHTDTWSQICQPWLLGRKMHHGLLSHLQPRHNRYTACRCMQTNLFLPVLLIFFARWGKIVFWQVTPVARLKQFLQWYTEARKVKECTNLSFNPACNSYSIMWGYSENKSDAAALEYPARNGGQHHWNAADVLALVQKYHWWKNPMSFLGCLKHYIFPPQPVISVMILEIPLYMYEDGVVHPLCSIDPFLWRTSLGSKPCSDSCLVNHLNTFSNRGPNSELKITLHCTA